MTVSEPTRRMRPRPEDAKQSTPSTSKKALGNYEITEQGRKRTISAEEVIEVLETMAKNQEREKQRKKANTRVTINRMKKVLIIVFRNRRLVRHHLSARRTIRVGYISRF